jgi:hypothetical protein
VRVTPEEKAEIALAARKVRLPQSRFLRELGLGRNPPSLVDLEALSILTRLRGDLGRLGGLLKLWLVEVPGRAVSENEVKAALSTVIEKQSELSKLISMYEVVIGEVQ